MCVVNTLLANLMFLNGRSMYTLLLHVSIFVQTGAIHMYVLKLFSKKKKIVIIKSV